MRYRYKPEIVQAARWVHEGENPWKRLQEELGPGYAVLRMLRDRVFVSSGVSQCCCDDGDWVITNEDGRLLSVPDAYFRERLEPIEVCSPEESPV